MFFQNTLLGWLNKQLIVITIVFYYVSLPIISLNIYKIGHRKTLYMLHLRVFDPPKLAPYLIRVDFKTHLFQFLHELPIE